MKQKPYKVISLFDVHFGEHIDLTPVFKFIKDEQPDEIVLGWDMIDLFTISKYYKWDKEDWIYKAQSEIKTFKKVLKKINKLVPKVRIVWLDWNHETRVREQIKANPERDKLINHWNEYWEYVDEFIKYNDFYKIWKLYRTHWIYHNDAHAKKTANIVKKNVLYWHLHTAQCYTWTSPVDDESHIAICVPCLCKKNPDYMGNKPNSRLNWFNITYFNKYWEFNTYTIIITDNKFIYWWKQYW